MYAIKLTNIFQDSYTDFHADGLLSERDIDPDADEHTPATFNSIESATNKAGELRDSFNGSPDIDVVKYPARSK
jgi:hypothetical protein